MDENICKLCGKDLTLLVAHVCVAMADPKARWLAEITYRTDLGPNVVTHDLDELEDLHDLVERGPHWDTIDLIQIFRVNHNTAPDLTVEAAAKL